MIYEYYQKTDTFVLILGRRRFDFGDRKENIITHYDRKGKPMAIEILDASRTAMAMMGAIMGGKKRIVGRRQMIPASGVTPVMSLSSGSTISLQLPVVQPGANAPTGKVPIGTSIAGGLWAYYSTVSAPIAHGAFNALTNCNYIYMATLTAQAT